MYNPPIPSFIVKTEDELVKTEAQWISIKPESISQIPDLQQIFEKGMGYNFVPTPLSKLHITLFRGIMSSLEFEQQKELMEKIAKEFFAFKIEIDLKNTRVKSRGCYVTWHFSDEHLQELQIRVQSATLAYLRSHNLSCETKEEFDPHITLGVINKECNREGVGDCVNHANIGFLKKNSSLKLSFSVEKVHLTGVNGLRLDISNRTHHNLFVISSNSDNTFKVEQLIHYATVNEFDEYRKIRLELKKKGPNKMYSQEFVFLIDKCLKEKSDQEKDSIYSILVKQQEKMAKLGNQNEKKILKKLLLRVDYKFRVKLIIKNELSINNLNEVRELLIRHQPKDITLYNKYLLKESNINYIYAIFELIRSMDGNNFLEKLVKNKVAKEQSRKNFDMVREILIREQPSNITLYCNYLSAETDMIHINTIFELVKNMSCVNDEIYDIFLRKLIHNKASIERIRIFFDEACTFFKNSDVKFVGTYLDAERTLENGSFEKIMEFIIKEMRCIILSLCIFVILDACVIKNSLMKPL